MRSSVKLSADRPERKTQPQMAVRAVAAPFADGISRLRVKLSQPDWTLILLLVLTIPAWATLLAPGYFFQAHDAHHSVFYLVEFDQAIRDGNLWPRWGPDHAMGYGYPLWIVYAPLAYYVAEAFHLLGFGFTVAVKLAWGLGFVFSAWGAYALGRRWWGRPAGLIAGLLYTYAPYHLLNIYVRAALAEFWAMAWFPWVLLAFDRLIERPTRGRLAVAALGLAAALLTHSVVVPVFVPWLMLFVLLRLVVMDRRTPVRPADRQTPVQPQEHRMPVRRLSPLLASLAAGLLGVMLAAIFLVPLLVEQRYAGAAQWVNNTYDVDRNFVYLHQLFSPFWGYGYSVAGPADGMGFQLGVMPLLLALAGAVIGLRRGARARSVTLFMLLTLVLTALTMLTWAAPLWQAFPVASLIQFPWRLLALTVLAMALLGGAAVAGVLADAPAESDARAWPAVMVYPLALLIVLASLPYTTAPLSPVTARDESPLAIMDFEMAHPDMIGVTAYAQERFSETPLLGQYLAGEPLQRAAIVEGSGTVTTVKTGAQHGTLRVDASTPVRVLYYTYYFPGWTVTADGEPVAIEPAAPYGLISFSLPAGQHQVDVVLGETPVRRLGMWVSVVALGVVVGLVVVRRRRPSANAGRE